MIVLLNGSFLPEAEATLPLLTRGLLIGDGVYATLQVRHGRPLFLEAHLEKLQRECLSLGIEPPTLSPASLHELIARNGATTGIFRLKIVASAAGSPSTMHLPIRPVEHLFSFLTPFDPPHRKPLTLTHFQTPLSSPHASVKTLAHLARYYVMEHARRQGCDDAVTTTEGGILLEAAFGNLLWHVDGVFYTPDRTLPLYRGMTVQKLGEAAGRLGMQVEEVRMRLEEIPEGANLYRCNTMSGLMPIGMCGGRGFARDERLEERLLEAYEAEIAKAEKCEV